MNQNSKEFYTHKHYKYQNTTLIADAVFENSQGKTGILCHEIPTRNYGYHNSGDISHWLVFDKSNFTKLCVELPRR